RTIGKGAAPVRAHGPLAGKTIIHIDDSPLLMRTGSYAAAHMAYDNIYVPVFFIHRFRILSCYRFLVKRMEDGFPFYPFQPGHTHFINEFIDDHGIGNHGFAAVFFPESVGYETAHVGSMSAVGAF